MTNTTKKKSEKHSVILIDEENRAIPDSRIRCESLDHAYAVAYQLLASGKRLAIIKDEDE